MSSASCDRRRWYTFLILLCGVLLVSSPAQEKNLSIYAQHTGYSLAVTERDGQEYVAIADVLEKLGVVAARIDGKKLQISFTPAEGAKRVELQFADGQTRAKLRGADVELASRFRMEGARGMVPVRSLPQLLARTLDTQVDFHERGRRLFVGNSGVRYSVELKTAPTRLVLSFGAPVNPSIATEPSGVRMVFTRDAIVAANASQPLDDQTMTAVNFSEANGTAEISVAANVPLVPKFSDGGRTITVTPVAASAAASADQLPAVPALPHPVDVVPQGPKFLVMIDPGHGGGESGAALGDMAEKDFNLSLGRRLRAEFESRGINTALMRASDIALSLDQRSLSANTAHATVYIAIHASPTGAGVRVYTSDLAPRAATSRHVFLPADGVQAAYVDRASVLAGNIVAELAKRQVGAASLPAPVRPLNGIAAPAIALEIAPPQNDLQGFASSLYQQSICSALTAAVEAMRARLERPR